MISRIVAVDPGLTTGLVNTWFDEGRLAGFEAFQLDHINTGNYFQDLAVAQHRVAQVTPIVLIEKFTITGATAKNSQAPWSLETIGICRYFCNKAGIEPKFQMPSQVMRLCTDDVLKRAGMWTPGQQHANDAARHALAFAMMDLGIMKECLKDE